jgi:hypothetical protein
VGLTSAFTGIIPVLFFLINRMTLDDSKVDLTIFKNNDSGYTSIPSPSHTPHSLYECTGFASVSFSMT